MTRRRSVDVDALALTADLLRSKSLVKVVAASADYENNRPWPPLQRRDLT